jgi:hypothetical protein
MLWAIGRMNDTWYQGRYLFPIIGPAMVLLALGIWNLLPVRMAQPAAAAIPLLMGGVSVFLLFAVIRPAFAAPPLAKWQLWAVPHRDDVTFGNDFRFLGYQARENDAGDELQVTLYWQSLRQVDFNFSVFVHLVDAGGQRVAQDDHAPGELAEFPPTRWWPEDLIAARYTLPLPEERASGPYQLWVGVYHWVSGERLPAFREGQMVGDYIVLELE